MAIAFDAASGAQAIAASSLSWSHTCSGGANRLLCVGGGNSSGTLGSISTITYNSVSLTNKFAVNDGTLASAMFFLVNPTSGSNTVLLTPSATQDELGGTASSYTGVDQSTPFDTAVTNTGTTSPATVNASSATGDLVIDAVYVNRPAITVGAGQTSRQEQENIDGLTSAGMSTEPGGATITMSWTFTNARWATGAVSINPASTSVRTGDCNVIMAA